MRRTNRIPERNGTARRVFVLTCTCSLLIVLESCLNPKTDGIVEKPAPQPTFQKAVKSYYHGSFDKSVLTLERLLSARPDNRRARWELVELFEEAGDYESAISMLRSLYGIEADTAKATESLFVARVLSGRLSAARSMLPLVRNTVETIFYEGLLSKETGERSRAVELFRRSVGMREHQPMAWYFLGELAYEAGDYRTAQIDFETVRRQNPDITIAIPPLARSILAQGKDREAYLLLLRAQDILPNNAGIKADIARLEREYPQLAKNSSTAAAMRRRDTIPPRVATFPSAAANAPEIRVGLAENLHSLTIKTGGTYRIRSLTPEGSLSYHGTSDQVLKLTSTGDEIALSAPGTKPFLSWTSPAVLSYGDPANTTVIFDLVTESGSFFATSSDRAYRGTMIFLPGPKGFTVVNRLPLEEYLYAVLPSEMYSSWPMEALKAQAVAARSYTLASMGTFASKDFDVYGSVRSAAYRGVDNESPSTTEAVNATQGQILEYAGKPLKAYYSANSGGYTEDSRVVWGEADGMQAVADLRIKNRTRFLSLRQLHEWLTSDPASYSSTPPFFSPSSYRWVKWVPAAELDRRANRIEKIGKVLAVLSTGRGISGRVDGIELIGVDGSLTVNGDRIRSVLGNLRSTLFISRPLFGPAGSPEYFIFTGGGWGHGVGMDQDGAAGMASTGFTYKQILSHYYPSARLEDSSSIPSFESKRTESDR